MTASKLNPSSSSAEEQLITLIESGNPIKEDEVECLFDKLKPVKSDFLIGSWKAGPYVETGHPGIQDLKDAKWDGKNFHSVDHVEPFMCLYKDSTRVFNEKFGHAVLRPVEFRGVLSTAMIYDNFPIIDHFRYVSENLLLGAMDTKMYSKESGILYFAIKRFTTPE